MHKKLTLSIIPLVLTALVIVVCFAFIVSTPVSASGAVDALFPDISGTSGSLVLDENMQIGEAVTVQHIDGLTLGYNTDMSQWEGFTPNLVRLGDLTVYCCYLADDYCFKAGTIFDIVDVEGNRLSITLTSDIRAKSPQKLENYISAVDAERTVYCHGSGVYPFELTNRVYQTEFLESKLKGVYPLDEYIVYGNDRDYNNYNPFILSFDTPVYHSSAGDNPWGISPFGYYDAQAYVIFKSFKIVSPNPMIYTTNGYPQLRYTYVYDMATGESTRPWQYIGGAMSALFVYEWTEEVGSDVSQRLYVMKDEEVGKYYLWLFRSGYGSSIIIEGKATASLPAVSLVNGGRYYYDNYFVDLDMYDVFGVPYEYDIQITAFDEGNAVLKWTYEFGETGGGSGDDSDDLTPITPPGIIEIPDIIGGVITNPGELPTLNLPFDFTAPDLTVDFTSAFNYAFNSTWLGVSDVYTDVRGFVDELTVKFVPDITGVFGSIVYTVETYSDAFRDTCREMRNTYAVPFYNLVVKISSLVPAPVWVVFDIWLFYCSARLIIYIFTCPLSDVIRRYF